MEKKKTTKTKMKVEKKTVKKPTVKSKTKKNTKKKGFTLIELLAVIIILGILMIIAIPSVTKYINDSRKSAYVDTAKEIVSGTRNLVNEGKLGMYDTGTTYYIPAKYVNTENSLKSPYGEFTDESAYVGVIYDGQGYKYYWISSDDTGQGIPNVKLVDKLDTDDIVSDLNPADIKSTVEKTGIGDRNNIKILNMNGLWDNIDGGATINITEDSGEVIKKGLRLPNTSGSALCGRTIIIDNFTTDGDGKITCSSSDPKIASCYVFFHNDKIRIRSEGVGTATITINQAASTNGVEASSVTYTFTTEGTCSWHYHKNYAPEGGAQLCWMHCLDYCTANYNAYIYSCWPSKTSPPERNWEDYMAYCWCKY